MQHSNIQPHDLVRLRALKDDLLVVSQLQLVQKNLLLRHSMAYLQRLLYVLRGQLIVHLLVVHHAPQLLHLVDQHVTHVRHLLEAHRHVRQVDHHQKRDLVDLDYVLDLVLYLAVRARQRRAVHHQAARVDVLRVLVLLVLAVDLLA